MAFNHRRRRHADDGGYSLILVIGFITIVLGLVAVGTTIAQRSLSSSAKHVAFEQALATAEDGIDAGLARVQSAYDAGYDYVTPSTGTAFEPTPDCNAAVLVFPTLTGAQSTWEQQERSWARTQLQALAAAQPGCRHHVREGDWVMMKPQGRQTVYAMSWVPSYGARGVKSRLLKSEYIFTPYKPVNAVLTGGDLEVDSSTVVTSAGTSAASLATVHANGSITVPSGTPAVYGAVSSSVSSGTTSSSKFYDTSNSSIGGQIPTTAQQSVPLISAREVYLRNWNDSSWTASWYDLCRDGKVRRPASGGPCTGTLIGDYGTGGALQGTAFNTAWTFDGSTSPPTWSVDKNMPDGVYYVDGANVAPSAGSGNTVTNRATIIAAAQSITCNKVGGSIDWAHNNIAAPMISSLFMLADQDLRTSSNFEAGSSSGGTVVSGLFVAGDQISLQTSSNGIYGAVLAADQCDPPDGTSLVDSDVVKNPTIYYDPNAQAPFADIVDTTLWLEYVG